jgi:hypothetical protein
MSDLDRKYAEKLLYSKDKEMKVSGGIIPLDRNEANMIEARAVLSDRNPESEMPRKKKKGIAKEGFDSAFPAALEAEHTRKSSPLGKYSPRAAALDAANKGINYFVGEDEARGRRHAQKAATMVEDPSKFQGVKPLKTKVTPRKKKKKEFHGWNKNPSVNRVTLGVE